MLEEFKWILVYLLRWKGGGGALVHVYVWEHIVTLNYRITWLIFTKLCRDKDPAHLYSLLGQIHLGADPEQGHNTSMRGPFSKEILLQSKMLQQQTECIAIIYKHLGVLMTPAHWAKSAQWWIQGRAIIGQWGPFSKGLLLQSWKATATNLMYSSDLTAFRKKCCYFFCSILMSSFWHALMLYCIGLGHFHLF